MVFHRASGAALAIGGLAGFLASVLHPQDPVDPANLPIHVLLYSAVMFLLLGLPGLGQFLGQHGGPLAFIGVVVLFFGVAFEDPLHSVLFFTAVPKLATSPAGRELLAGPPPGLLLPIQFGAGVLIIIGIVLTATIILRTRAMSLWLVVLPLIAGVGLLIGIAIPPANIIAAAALYLGLAGWGLPLLRVTRFAPTLIGSEGTGGDAPSGVR